MERHVIFDLNKKNNSFSKLFKRNGFIRSTNFNQHGFNVYISNQEGNFTKAKENYYLTIGFKLDGEDVDYRINSKKELLILLNQIKIYSEIERTILKRKTDKPYIIGMNGVDTSGKTYFSKGFQEYLMNRNYRVQIIHMDDFHHLRHIRNQGENQVDSYFQNAFNLKKLEKEILLPIHLDKAVFKTLKLVNLDTDSYEVIKTYEISTSTIVIIEGVLLYRRPINSYFDLRIFLDIPFKVMLNRAKKRDVPKFGKAILNQYRNKYIPVQKKYLQEYKPKDISDLIINNTDFNYPKIIENRME